MKKIFRTVPFGSTEFIDLLNREAFPYEGSSVPLETILNQLQSHPLSCRTAVFEYKYVDKDYQDEFSTFYSKALKHYPHRCTRLHFFSNNIPTSTRIRFGKFRRSYLGFIVLRPTDLNRVGRTILKPPITDENCEFINCLAPFKSHIYGEKFCLDAMPFIQQDTQVGACAQAALWMLARYMSHRFGYREFLPGEINRLAKSTISLGRHFPASDGLNYAQILDALQGMGFSAIIYDRKMVDRCSPHIDHAFPVVENTPQEEASREFQRVVKLADITYRYIESGLPVLLATSNHALVAIGHKYDFSNTTAQVAIQRIPSFYVNNDNTGPYLKLPIFTNRPPYSFPQVQAVIAVMPPEATLRGEEAEWMAVRALDQLLQERPPGANLTLRDILPQHRAEFNSWFQNREYRTYLIKSVEFQQDLRSEMKNGHLKRNVGQRLLVRDYPKYIWVTEVSSPPLLNNAEKGERQCLGRVLVDSTAPARTRGILAIHFADILLIESRQDTTRAEHYYFPNTTPFKHKLW